MPFEAVIGLEIHAQLQTASKIFCGCSTAFGAPPNTQVCPVCLGLPGALPVLNRAAVDHGIRAALALGCHVNERSIFARKNYFYPDLPKGYQISQYEQPLASGGALDLETPGGRRQVGITRVHLEEDAGKSLHEGFPDSDRRTYVDFNRSGTPLIEIVTEPDLRSAADAAEFFAALRTILVWLGVNDGNMEEGSLRCDANVSVRPTGASTLGTKAEVKNLNSFRFLQRALEYEIGRQVDLVERGARVVQETRLWDAGAGATMSMRSKEEAHDYRYFPEPDLPPVVVDAARIRRIEAEMPELPDARRQRFIAVLGLPAYDAAQLTQSRAQADFFEATIGAGAPGRAGARPQGRGARDRAVAGRARTARRAPRAHRRQDDQRRHGQGRLRKDVRDRDGGGRHRSSRRARADRRRGADRGRDRRGPRAGARRRGAVQGRQGGHLRVSRRPGHAGGGREGEPQARQRALAQRARGAFLTVGAPLARAILSARIDICSRQPWIHRQRDRDLSPLQALRPRRLRAARPLDRHRQGRIPLSHRSERCREVHVSPAAAPRGDAERR
jgi:aspartyl/glutamyl-tRNA(Asn/Gln) amidotransferase B subunit